MKDPVLKPIAHIASFALAIGIAFLAVTSHVDAKAKATPTPTPSPAAAAPTATPEPAAIAIPRLQGRLKANPADQDAMTQLSQQFLSIGRPDLAVPITQQLIKLGNKSAQTYYLDGSGMEALGQTQAAVADFEQASTIDPTNLAVLSQLTDLYLQTNRPNDAERVAKRALTFNKTESGAMQNMGIVYASEGHYDDARVQFEAAAVASPTDTSPIIAIAKTYAAQNNLPMALKTVDRALAIAPGDTQTLVYKADLYGKEHDEAHVGPAYDDAVVSAKSDDEKVQILIRKASYYNDDKKPDQVAAVLNTIVTTYPKVAAGHVALGDLYVSQKQIPKGVAEWQVALGLDKDNAPALLRLGQNSLMTGKYNDAVGFLKRFTAVSQSDAQGWAMLGQAYSYVHDYSRSRQACSNSFQIQRQAETLACVGGADFELKNYKEAAQIFDTLDQNAKGFLDQNPQMLFIAAKSYENTKQKPKAIAAYKRLLAPLKKGSPAYKTVAADLAKLTKKK